MTYVITSLKTSFLILLNPATKHQGYQYSILSLDLNTAEQEEKYELPMLQTWLGAGGFNEGLP